MARDDALSDNIEEEDIPTLLSVDEEKAGEDADAVQHFRQAYMKLKGELAQVVVGQEVVVEQLMVAIFARGHALLVGVPGLAKTLLVSSLAKCLTLDFNRIQFTPDLMPSDITGTEVIQDDPETGERRFKFLKGPIFANIILADEINRTPPKTQAAMLQAMQERFVSVGGENYPLQEPFFVLATQNPIEQEGTYPLPEAQLDRFLLNVMVDYPTDVEELAIMKLATASQHYDLKPVLSGDDVLYLQKVVRRVPVADHIFAYARALVRATRPTDKSSPDFIKQYVTWGAGPRGSLNLILAGKARAILRGNYYVSYADIEAAAYPVLRHRIITNFTAQTNNIDSDEIVRRLLKHIPKTKKL